MMCSPPPHYRSYPEGTKFTILMELSRKAEVDPTSRDAANL